MENKRRFTLWPWGEKVPLKNHLFSVGITVSLFLSLIFSSWGAHGAGLLQPPSVAPITAGELPAGIEEPIRHGIGQDKVIALTFDDGLKPATLEISSILRENNAKATWFVTGRSIPGNEDILSELVAAGDEIANHTTNHVSLPTQTSEQVKEELSTTDQLLKDLVPNVTHYWRPPGGEMNDTAVQTAKSLGLINVLWSVTLSDFVVDRTEEQMVSDLLSVKPGDIVLLHNSPVKAMHDALRRSLPELTKEGYRFVTVTELLRSK